MNSYEVIMTPNAIDDLLELRDYISGVLLSPQTVKSYICFIREKISRLEFMPSSIAPVVDEPWCSRGIRRIIAKKLLYLLPYVHMKALKRFLF